VLHHEQMESHQVEDGYEMVTDKDGKTERRTVYSNVQVSPWVGVEDVNTSPRVSSSPLFLS